MTLLAFLLRLPWLPVRGFVKLALVIRDEAEREMASPVTIQLELEHAGAGPGGEMSHEQAAESQDAAFAEFTRARRSTGEYTMAELMEVCSVGRATVYCTLGRARRAGSGQG